MRVHVYAQGRRSIQYTYSTPIVLLRYRVQFLHFLNVRIQSPGTHYGRSDTVLIANVCGSVARPGARDRL